MQIKFKTEGDLISFLKAIDDLAKINKIRLEYQAKEREVSISIKIIAELINLSNKSNTIGLKNR